MRPRLPLSRKLAFAFGLTSLITFAVGVVGWQRVNGLNRRVTDLGERQVVALRQALAIARMHDALRAVVFRSILAAQTGNTDEMEASERALHASSKNLEHALTELDAVAVRSESHEARRLIEALRPDLTAFLSKAAEIFKLASVANTADALLALPEFEARVARLEGRIDALQRQVENVANLSVANGAAEARDSLAIALAAALAGVVSALTVSVLFTKSLLNTERQLEQDMAERIRAEEKARQERDFSTTALDSIPGLFVVLSADARLIRWNRKLEIVSAHTASEIGAMRPEDLVIAADREAVARMIRQGFADGWAEVELNLITKNNDVIPHFLKGSRLLIDGQTCLAVIGIDITERREAANELARLNRELIDASRHAGMAEVATSVLHNVGNVLNSVNVSVTLVADGIRHSRLSALRKAFQLLHEQEADLAAFLSRDPKGRRLPGFLQALGEELSREQARFSSEMDSVRQHVDHIKQIVAMQQSYAKVSGTLEDLAPGDLVEDAFRMSAFASEREPCEVVRDYGSVPLVRVDRHKVLQILINLINNARHALADRPADRRLVFRLSPGQAQRVRIEITDNGSGIAAENLTRIFQHGFTTRKSGHGFGLHSGANAAREMGGTLSVQSEGPGTGATFVLELPAQPAMVADSVTEPRSAAA